MSKSNTEMIKDLNKKKEIENYNKFKESLESCRKKLSRCDYENIK